MGKLKKCCAAFSSPAKAARLLRARAAYLERQDDLLALSIGTTQGLACIDGKLQLATQLIHFASNPGCRLLESWIAAHEVLGNPSSGCSKIMKFLQLQHSKLPFLDCAHGCHSEDTPATAVVLLLLLKLLLSSADLSGSGGLETECMNVFSVSDSSKRNARFLVTHCRSFERAGSWRARRGVMSVGKVARPKGSELQTSVAAEQLATA